MPTERLDVLFRFSSRFRITGKIYDFSLSSKKFGNNEESKNEFLSEDFQLSTV